MNLQKLRDDLLMAQGALVETVSVWNAPCAPIMDRWARRAGEPLQGDGVTCVFEANPNDKIVRAGHDATAISTMPVIEKGGVNFSHVRAERLPEAATTKRPELAGLPFEAMGVSVVMHPINPFVPTSHANVRALVVHRPDAPVWWFGGGFDLTPYYPFDEDIRAWHQHAKNACDTLSPTAYADFKAECDAYFYLKHRGETRGVGGIFFDDLGTNASAEAVPGSLTFEQGAAFILAVFDAYHKAYAEIVERRRNTPFGARERDFQCYRRGRYVEFNLLYDRGTAFGLQSGGRTESILMSLPNVVHWRYDYQPEAGSKEAALADYLKPRDWL